jgi:hypothetical protein
MAKNDWIHVRTGKALTLKLAEMADKEQRSTSDFVRITLEKALGIEHEKKQRKH